MIRVGMTPLSYTNGQTERTGFARDIQIITIHFYFKHTLLDVVFISAHIHKKLLITIYSLTRLY